MNGSEIILKIIGDPDKVEIIEFEDVANLFELTLDGQKFDFSWDDIFYIFIVPVESDFDGELVNIAEKHFIYVISDDLYYAEIPIQTTTNGNIVTQSANYTTEGVNISVMTKIDKSTGVMEYVSVESSTSGTLIDYLHIDQTSAIHKTTEEASLPFTGLFNLILGFSVIIAVYGKLRRQSR